MQVTTGKPLTLTAALFLLIGALTLALTLTLTLLGGRTAGQQILIDQGRYLASTAARLADLVDQSIAERGLDVLKLSRSRALARSTTSQSAVRAELQALRTTFPQFAWIGLTTPTGIVRVATGGLLEGIDVSGRPWFQRSLSQPYIGDLHDAKLLATLLDHDRSRPLRFVDVCAPVHDASGELIGVLGAHLYADWIRELIDAFLARIPRASRLQIVILNSDRDIIFGGEHPLAQHIRRLAPAPGTGAQKSGFIAHRDDVDAAGYTGYAVIDGFQDFHGLDWMVLVHQTRSELLAPVRKVQRRMALSGLMCGLLFLALGYGLARSASLPMKRLSESVGGARNIRDLANMPEQRGYAELAEFTTTLREMADRLLEGERELRIHRSLRELQQATIRDLETTANTDALTGVPNRRAFDRLLQSALEAASPEFPVTVALFDLDHFKRINDEFGHPGGDKVLQAVANHINSAVRSSDSFARVGGEEFALIYPATDAETAVTLVERVRSEIAAIPIAIDGHEQRVTASFGVTTTGDPAIEPATLLRHADRALYAAKSAGRNCVRIAVPK